MQQWAYHIERNKASQQEALPVAGLQCNNAVIGELTAMGALHSDKWFIMDTTFSGGRERQQNALWKTVVRNVWENLNQRISETKDTVSTAALGIRDSSCYPSWVQTLDINVYHFM
jgi:hypothetical protein